jgi:hypothetical protein
MKIKDQLWLWGPALIVIGYIGYLARTNMIRLHYKEVKNDVEQSYIAEFGYMHQDFGDIIANEAIVEQGIKYDGITEETVKMQKAELANKIAGITTKYKDIVDKINEDEMNSLKYWWMPVR